MPPENNRSWTRIVAQGKTIRIELPDLEQMQRSLQAYLKERRRDLDQLAPPEILEGIERTAGEVWIDRDRKAHIGLWRLAGRITGAFLTYRPSPRTPIQFEAKLIDDGGMWKVAEVLLARYVLR